MATTRTDPKLSLANGKKARSYEGLTREQLIEAYRLMNTSRRIDDREIILKRQQKVFFQMSGAGHEAISVAAGMVLKAAYDWFYPYYRDRALCLALGAKPLEMFLQAVGAADDPTSGGRQMPMHWGYKNLNVVTQSSPTGSQILQAVGCAEAGRYFAQRPKAAEIPTTNNTPDYRQFKDVTFHGDEVTYVSLGEGTTSEGEFWEAMNAAALSKLPVIFCVQDNGYAISVPVEVQTAGGSISRLVSGFPNFHFEEVDGTDPVASYGAFHRAAQYCRDGHGPAFVHAHVIRPYSHSLSDDERLYRPDAELERDAARDPVSRMQMFLLREGILDEKGINELEKRVEEELQVAVDLALAALPPAPESIFNYVYSPDLDPTSEVFATPPRVGSDPADGKKPDGEDHSRPNQRYVARRDEARRAHCDLRRGRGRLQPRGVLEAQAGERQRWSLQTDLWLAERVWPGPCVQYSAGRSRHRGPRHRHGYARAEAGGGDSILRLHLAGDDADSQRNVGDSLALK